MKMHPYRFNILLGLAAVFCVTVSFSPASDMFISKTGKVKFVSDAPLEMITAQSAKMGVAINVALKSVAFKVPVSSFEGFNSALQREHFNENYMESGKYVNASFNGKIIEDVDLTVQGTYKVRAKGMLDVHGVQKERIVSGTINVTATSIRMEAKFDVPVADHDITIPKIVYQKISDVIKVDVSAELKPQN